MVERLKTEEIKKDGLASIIKYEGDADTLVWKHPIEDFNLGSQLIVHESQEAIFFRDGQAWDTFTAGRYTLETQQLPILDKSTGMCYTGTRESPERWPALWSLWNFSASLPSTI